jgi:hypothetical protein
VPSFVVSLIAEWDESLVTSTAFVWLVTIVNAQVDLQISLLWKNFFAARMRTYKLSIWWQEVFILLVYIKPVFACKSLSTYPAYKVCRFLLSWVNCLLIWGRHHHWVVADVWRTLEILLAIRIRLNL